MFLFPSTKSILEMAEDLFVKGWEEDLQCSCRDSVVPSLKGTRTLAKGLWVCECIEVWKLGERAYLLSGSPTQVSCY